MKAELSTSLATVPQSLYMRTVLRSFHAGVCAHHSHVLLVKIVLVAEHRLLHVVADARDVSQVNLVVTHADHVVNHARVTAQSQQDGKRTQNFGAKNQRRNDTELLTSSLARWG
jgi:hypothetical protein